MLSTKIIPAKDTSGYERCSSLSAELAELTEDHCDDGCGEVIDYSVQAYFPGDLGVQGCNACGHNAERKCKGET